MRAESQDLQIKLTVTQDEHPELHRVLLAIVQPRRRTRRLKDLAATGLLLERAGGISVSTAQPATSAAGQAVGDLGDALSVALWEDKAG
jgi:hypothetical protein